MPLAADAPSKAERVRRQLDREGKPAQPFAASKRLERGARIVVLSEGMAGISSANPRVSAHRRAPRPDTVYSGKDSGIFMEEVLGWLARR